MKPDKEKAPCVGAHSGDLRNNNYLNSIGTNFVFCQGGQAYTTSLVIAEGIQRAHKDILELIRKYLDDFSSFGKITFETLFNKQGKSTRYAILNERQATLLFTYMRNTEIIRKFKIWLVSKFYEMAQAQKESVKIITKTRQPKIDNKRIKLALRLHEECGWNKSDIACLMDISRPAVSGWIRGTRRPEDLARIKQSENRQLETENKNLQKLAFIERFLESAPVDTVEYHVPIIHDMISSVVDDMSGV